MSEPAKNPLKLFYCYAHKDKDMCDALDSHLSSLKREKLIEIWYDGKISAGTEWENEINKHLSTADIILLLVSADFLASDYCYSKEMARALQRHEEGTVRVVPIILRPVYWDNAPFRKIQALPTGAKPVTKWKKLDEAYEDIVRCLHGVVKELQTAREIAAEAEEWFQKGIAFNKSKRHTEAIEALDRVIQLNSDNALAYNYKGDALYNLKRYEEALLAYEQAVRLNPNNARAYNGKGNALRKLNQYEEALGAYEQALRLDPNDARVYSNKGNALSGLRRYKEALVMYEQALRLDTNAADAYYNKGLALFDLKRYKEALAAYEQVLRLDPNDADARHSKKLVLDRLKRSGTQKEQPQR